MNFSTLAARCARAMPARMHVGLPVLIMVAFYWLSSLPGTPTPEDPEVYLFFHWLPPSVQNLLHVPAYAALSWAWRWALRAWLPVGAQWATAWVFASLYGVFDEWHQSFVPDRIASLTDVAFDVAGAAVGVWLAGRADRLKLPEE